MSLLYILHIEVRVYHKINNVKEYILMDYRLTEHAVYKIYLNIFNRPFEILLSASE